MRRAPVLIVGGGPAGSAAAITLARLGLAAELVERSSGPRDPVCGAFLSADSLAMLAALGIDVEALGATRLDRLRIVSGAAGAELDLPFAAAGLSRRRLDAALLEAAAAAGATVRRGLAAREVEPESRLVRLGDGDEVLCGSLFLATGKHELRGAQRQREGRAHSSIGLRAGLPHSSRRQSALAGVVELHLFDQGYAGLLLVEDGSCNLCLSASRARLAAAGGAGPLVGQVLAEAPLLAERIGADLPRDWQAVAGIPYGWKARETGPGLFRLGDQAAVIASLAGDGIAIALASGIGAGTALADGGAEASPAWQRRFRARSRIPLAAAEMLRWGFSNAVTRRVLVGIPRHAAPLAALAARWTRIVRI